MKKIIIIDVERAECFLDEFSKKWGLQAFNATAMTEKLFVNNIFWDKFVPHETLLIFPGNGANVLRRYIPIEWLDNWQCINVSAKRFWQPGSYPRVIVNPVVANKVLVGFKMVVVIDDVVSSGLTMKLIREKSMPWLPGVRWNFVTWVMQRSANIRGYDLSNVAEFVGTPGTKAPINSLSTLMQNQLILRDYASRHIRDPDNFIKFIRGL